MQYAYAAGQLAFVSPCPVVTICYFNAQIIAVSFSPNFLMVAIIFSIGYEFFTLQDVGAEVGVAVDARVVLVVGPAVKWVVGAAVGLAVPHATDSSPMVDMLILLRKRSAALFDKPSTPVGVPVLG